ncbi:hypothetical protein K439DRAFT_880924 [Ramaria rubella]|nr:hypothetical protein K439DRAFT_880924 [Ramaria rubella]
MQDENVSQITITLENNYQVGYCLVASFMILVYDHILTLDSEIQLVWNVPFGVGQALYFGTTYSAWLDCMLLLCLGTANISPEKCALLDKAALWLITWGTLLAEAVLAFRTWALWGSTRQMGLGFLLVWAMVAIACSIFGALGIRDIKFQPNPVPGVLETTCWLTQDVGVIAVGSYIVGIVFELVMLGMVVYKGKQHLRQNNSRLIATLYRDGILFYVYLIGFSFLNMAVLATAPTPGPSFVLTQRVLHSVFTKRMLLNIRGSATQEEWELSAESDNTQTALSTVIWYVDTEAEGGTREH